MSFHPRFKEDDLTKSDWAIRHEVDNDIPANLKANAHKLSHALGKIEEALQKVLPGARLIVTSGYRSPKVNAGVGGSPTSAHKYALAADVTCPGMSNMKLAEFVCEVLDEWDQVILEFGRWVHIGLGRDGGQPPRKQKLTAKKQNGKTVYLVGFHA